MCATVGEPGGTVERVFREESGRVLATLIRVLGDFDLAEEAVQEAFVVALERWPSRGVPGAQMSVIGTRVPSAEVANSRCTS